MKEVFHENFHVIEKLPAGVGRRKRLYILDTWRPKENVWLVGCAIGLLCCKSDNYEIYLAVSKNPALEPAEFFVGLKKDWLFYRQRDVYTYSTGIDDLVGYHFLPAGHGFRVRKGEPVYIKVGAINFTRKDLEYDAFCNLYFTKAK